MNNMPIFCFEDFDIGQHIMHAIPRTVGDGETAQYIALTGSRCAAASSVSTARLCGLPTRPIDWWLVFNLAFSQTVKEISSHAIANLGYAQLIFRRPVFAGDTMSSMSEVIGLRRTSKGDSGIVYVRSRCVNQHGQDVMSWIRWVLLPCREAAEGTGGAKVPDLESCVAPEQLSPGCRFDGGDALTRWCTATGSNRLWEDFQPGETIIHPLVMTVEEADHMSATRLYQNSAQVHFADSASPTGRRLVYGGHVISLCQSMSQHGLENIVQPAAINGGRHVRPLHAGDELHAVTRVISAWHLPGRSDIAALRLRLLGVRGSSPDKSAGISPEDPDIVLDLDYTAIMPCTPV